MSFKDNLVYLRTSNGLTQERLAVLLGVSRQAISKWESDHAYPEMDKLLTICQVFDCGLDDLVQGDLTHPSPRDSGENHTHLTSTPVKTLGVAAQPKTEDFTGYDQHWRSFAWRLGVGIGLIVAGLAAAAATSDLLPQALADLGLLPLWLWARFRVWLSSFRRGCLTDSSGACTPLSRISIPRRIARAARRSWRCALSLGWR